MVGVLVMAHLPTTAFDSDLATDIVPEIPIPYVSATPRPSRRSRIDHAAVQPGTLHPRKSHARAHRPKRASIHDPHARRARHPTARRRAPTAMRRQARRDRQARRRSVRRRKRLHSDVRSHDAVHGAHAVGLHGGCLTALRRHGTRHAHHATWLARSHAERILGKREPDAAFDAVVQRVTVELVQRLGCERDVFKLHEAHGPVLLGAEAESLVATLFGKHGLELVFGGVDGEIADI